ncbi:MAG: CHAT domain-containing protein [Calditrichaeota bacterium]|nr:CHAT domain-containing protein [Calditrichota bacterium]MCB0304993.1 CHAT domain-containing protein [Calditrichota bacterium]
MLIRFSYKRLGSERLHSIGVCFVLQIFILLAPGLIAQPLGRNQQNANSHYLAGYHAFEALDIEKAEKLLEQAVAAGEQIRLEQPLALARTLSCLGMVKEAAGQLDLAIGSYQKALALREGVLPQDDPLCLLSKADLAWAYGSNGQFEPMMKLSKEINAITNPGYNGDATSIINSNHFNMPTKRDYLNAVDSAMKSIPVDTMVKYMREEMLANSEGMDDSLIQSIAANYKNILENNLNWQDMIPPPLRDPAVPDTARLDPTALWSADEKAEFGHRMDISLLIKSVEQLERNSDQLGQPQLWRRRLRPSGPWQSLTNLFMTGNTPYHRMGNVGENEPVNFFMSNPFKLSPDPDRTHPDSTILKKHTLAGKYEDFLQHKGNMLKMDQRQHQYLRTARGDDARTLAAQIRELFNKQAWYLSQPAAFWETQSDAELLALSKMRDELLSDLARQSAPAAAGQFPLAVVTTEMIARALPAQTTLIEYFKFQFSPFDEQMALMQPIFDSLDAIGSNRSNSSNVDSLAREMKKYEARLNQLSDFTASRVHYGVFILPAQNAADLKMVDLGPADIIDSLIYQCRLGLQEIAGLNVDLPNIDIFQQQVEDSERSIAATSKALYHRLFMPVAAHLPEDGSLFIAPDGDLHLLPFAMLVDERGKYLVDRYQLKVVDSGKNLLGKAQTAEVSGGFTIFADPDFDAPADTPGRKPTIPGGNSGTYNMGNLFKMLLENGFSVPEYPAKFRRLQGTRAEAELIQQYAPRQDIKIYSAAQASEERLYQVRRPWRLHIATHGFFNSLPSNIPFQENEFAYMQTGLALSRYNQHKTLAQYERGTENDGVVTAHEIFANMDLTGTDLVVLSACETGLGTIKQGEGVYGLRRAFQMAGAQSVVMSLWRVKDKTTAALMSAFYENLANGMDKSTALHRAMLKIKTGISTHPYFWAPFIYAESSS